jgi:type I restriction enzyme, S subunit
LEHLEPLELKIKRHGSPNDIIGTKLRFKSGQILFGKRRFYQKKLAIAECDGICSAHMLVLEAISDKILISFLPFLMQSDIFYQKALMISEGSLSPTIKWKNLAKQEFLIPSKQIQQKIINLISNIDQSITKTQYLLEKLKTYKNTKANELLTRGIGHTKFKKVKSLFGKYEEIPEDWKLVSINDFTINHKQGFYTNQRYSKTGTRLVRITDLQNPILDYESMPLLKLSEKDVSDFKVNKGDFLFARSGAIGRFGIATKDIPCVFGSYIIRFVFDSTKILNDYFGYFYQTSFVETQLNAIQQGSSNININAENIKSIKIKLPPVLEQQKIAFILSNIDEQINQLENHLTKLKTMRKSIINEKLTPPKMEYKIVQ